MFEKLKYKNDETVFYEEDFFTIEGEILPVLRFAAWDDFEGIKHCFTTRDGGVSDGIYRSLNFRKNADDLPENVRENFRRVAEVFESTEDHIVYADQTHTANVRVITSRDAGKGITVDRDFSDVDGLITNEKGIILFTSHADCVPIYFYDPSREVIGLSHSGWRGTVECIGRRTVELMSETYGSKPGDIYAAIGPSICQDCYEVSADVATEVEKLLDRMCAADESIKAKEMLLKNGKAPDKYQLDLWELNRLILLSSGISEDHITVTNLCTCCNPNRLFSHRATGGRRGNLGAFIMLV